MNLTRAIIARRRNDHDVVLFRIQKGIIPGDFRVENAILRDDPRIDIGQQWVGYGLLASELPQCLLVVVRDGVKLDIVLFKLFISVAQLT